MSRLSRRFRSPAVATVFAAVVSVAGIAVAGSAPEGVAHGVPDVERSSTGEEASEGHPASTGAEISELARTTDLTGWEKGAAISTLASGGRSQAGMHGPHAGETVNEAWQDEEHAEDHAGKPEEVNPAGPPEEAPAQAGGPTRG